MRVTTVRFSVLTDRQIAELAEWWGASTITSIIAEAISRAWQQEQAQRQAEAIPASAGTRPAGE